MHVKMYVCDIYSSHQLSKHAAQCEARVSAQAAHISDFVMPELSGGHVLRQFSKLVPGATHATN